MNAQQHNLYQRIRDGITVSRYPLFKEYVVEQSGMSIRYLYRVMQGEHPNPAIKVLQAVADWFGCSIEAVLDPSVILADTLAIKSKSVQGSSDEGSLARLFNLNKEAA